MRAYFIRLTNSDLTQNGSIWKSGVIDLYDNSHYKNYSVTKSNYGLNSLGDRTWTGMQSIDATHTNSGKIVNHRFIDTTGRIDLVSYNLEVTATNAVTTIDGEMAIETSETGTDPWTYQSGFETGDVFGIIDSFRYARFTLTLNADATVNYNFVVEIRVEIDRPVMTPRYSALTHMLYNYPEWMNMREANYLPATPELATPMSLGGTLINAMAGEWVEDLSQQQSYLAFQHYIDTVDLNQVAWIYRCGGFTEDNVWSVVGDGVVLANAWDLREFYDAGEVDVYFRDDVTGIIYTRKLYNQLLINNTVGLQTLHNVWNAVDELGLIVDLRRIQNETNANFRLRILDVSVNKPGVGVDSFKLALRRELNLWQYWGSTPDSEFSGATPELLELSDIEKDPLYLDPEGMPTERFVRLADRLSRQYPNTWGRFRWPAAYWDLGGEKHEGFSILPARYDATPLLDADTQSGVGDGDDLYVYRPGEITGPHAFTGKIVVRGREKLASHNEYPKLKFEVQVYGQADKKIFTNPITIVFFTAEIVVSGVTYVAYFGMDAVRGADPSMLNPSSAQTTFPFFSSQDTTDARLRWRNKATGVEYQPSGVSNPLGVPYQFNASDITSLTVHNGTYDFTSHTYTSAETSDTFRAWFSDDPATQITYTTPQTTTSTHSIYLVLESLVGTYTVGKWQSEKYLYTIELNGANPNNAKQVKDLVLPHIIWDDYLETVPNKEIIVEFVTTRVDGEYGAYAHGINDEAIFVGIASIAVDGSSVWTSHKKSLSPSTTSIQFSSIDGVGYPVAVMPWQLVEYHQLVAFDGIVDENGPWRNNLPAEDGNTNFDLLSLNLTRTDFGIPNTSNFVLTWIGVETDDSDVILWLNSNTIDPAVNDTTMTFPPTAIKESLDEDTGVYYFEPFQVKARVRPDVAPQWNPRVNSGWFYDGQDEYYLYADPVTEYATGNSIILQDIPRQGAPIIVYAEGSTPERELRQVSFFDATPSLQIQNRQTLIGNNSRNLYLAYEDVYKVAVKNITTGAIVTLDTSTSTNVIRVTEITSPDYTYEATYTLRGSFFADNDYLSGNNHRSHLVFDATPQVFGSSHYAITYEGSLFDPATEVDLPLSPVYSSVEEGYIFISYNLYTLDKVEISLAPGVILADGRDYMVVTVKATDMYENPKPGASFTLSSNFGTLDATTVLTGTGGYVTTVLRSTVLATGVNGLLTVTGTVSASIPFHVQVPEPHTYTILAMPVADQIPADGVSRNAIFGRLEDLNHRPVPGGIVSWKRARSLYELYGQLPATPETGVTIANSDGTFNIGPFTAATPSAPGYWFLSMETHSATPIWPGSATPLEVSFSTVGDVVFWNEYPSTTYALNDSGIPRRAIQMATPIESIPPYSATNRFPVYYDEQLPDGSTPVHVNWLPPRWFALSRYTQYQLGLMGATPRSIDSSYLTTGHRVETDI